MYQNSEKSLIILNVPISVSRFYKSACKFGGAIPLAPGAAQRWNKHTCFTTHLWIIEFDSASQLNICGWFFFSLNKATCFLHLLCLTKMHRN